MDLKKIWYKRYWHWLLWKISEKPKVKNCFWNGLKLFCVLYAWILFRWGMTFSFAYFIVLKHIEDKIVPLILRSLILHHLFAFFKSWSWLSLLILFILFRFLSQLFSRSRQDMNIVSIHDGFSWPYMLLKFIVKFKNNTDFAFFFSSTPSIRNNSTSFRVLNHLKRHS